MKRIAVLVGMAAVFAILPQAAWGQTPETRYGSGPCAENVVPKGKYQYPVGIDEKTIALKVDPVFAEKMKKERFLENLPVTPIYDLVVEAVPIFGFCYTEKPEQYKTELPKALPFLGALWVDGEKILPELDWPENSGRVSDDGRPLYQWKFKGWEKGIAPDAKLEKLIEAIQHNDPSLKFIIEFKNPDGSIGRMEKGVTFNLCAPLWGNGQHKVVYERGKSAGLDVPALVSGRAEKVRIDGFEKVDPYKKYKDAFSHLVDLANRDDVSYLYGIEKSTTPTEHMDAIPSDSSCKLQRGDYAYTTYNYILYANVKVLLGGGEINGVASPKGRNTVVRSSIGVDTVMHEFGHLFADFRDEDGGYGVPHFGSVEAFRKEASKNCSFSPSVDFTYEGKLYSNKPDSSTKGCNHIGGIIDLPPNNPLMKAWNAGESVEINSDTPSTPVYRPSPTSLMNYGKNRPMQLNVVACGWAIATIKRSGGGPEYFPECMGLDTVKPTGVAAILPPARFLASISSVLPATPQSSEQNKAIPRGAVIFERDTPLDGVPAAGVVWYDGEPMPPSLKFPEPDTASVIKKLRDRLKELTIQRDELKARRNMLRGIWSVPAVPSSPSPLLNAAPFRQQLGDMSTVLQSILEAMQGAVR